jgi:hypothetical protein
VGEEPCRHAIACIFVGCRTRPCCQETRVSPFHAWVLQAAERVAAGAGGGGQRHPPARAEGQVRRGAERPPQGGALPGAPLPLAFSPSPLSTACLQTLLIIHPLPSAPPHHPTLAFSPSHHPPLAFSPSALAASSCPCNSSSLPFVFMRATRHLSRSLLRRSSPDAAVSLALSRC